MNTRHYTPNNRWIIGMPLMHSFANERERERDEGELPFSYIKFEKLEKRVYINYFLHLI